MTRFGGTWTRQQQPAALLLLLLLQAATTLAQDSGLVCDAFSDPFGAGSCGRRVFPRARILGGRAAMPGEFPSNALFIDDDGNQCGGTIIDRQFVLTGASCPILLDVNNFAHARVYAGNILRNVTADECSRQERKVLGVYVHPEFRTEYDYYENILRIYHDVAILVVEPFDFTDFVQRACLPECNLTLADLPSNGWIAGFGPLEKANNSFGFLIDSNNTELQALEVDFLDDERCRSTKSQICVIHKDGEKGACYGDYASPLYIVKDGVMTVIGSYNRLNGSECGGPVIYNFLSYYCPWIKKILASPPLLSEAECQRVNNSAFNSSVCEPGSYISPLNKNHSLDYATRGEFPWHATVIVDGLMYTGVLIDDRHMLIEGYIFRGKVTYAYAGTVSSNVFGDDCTRQRRKVLRILSIGGLVTLLTTEPFELNAFVNPICRNSSVILNEAVVAGYQILKERSSFLQKLSITSERFIDNCNTLHSFNFFEPFTPKFICSTVPFNHNFDDFGEMINFQSDPPSFVGFTLPQLFHNISAVDISQFNDHIDKTIHIEEAIGIPNCDFLKYNPFNGSCGQRSYIAPRIIGGREAKYGQYPWQASLAVGDGSIICGAVIISETLVLTAAHCIPGSYGPLSTDLYVYAGHMYTDIRYDECSRQKRKVLDAIPHPDFYGDYDITGDIALLKVEKFDLNVYIQAACLPTINQKLPSTGWVSGYGRTHYPRYYYNIYDSGIPDVLQDVEVDIYEDQRCRNETPGRNATGKICIKHKELGKGPCYGDSGGPLVTIEGNTATLLGITSGAAVTTPGGDFCGSLGFYTSVAFFLPWLKQRIDNPELFLPTAEECKQAKEGITYNKTCDIESYKFRKNDTLNLTLKNETILTGFANRGEFPWHVSIFEYFNQVQSGVLIDKSHILTTSPYSRYYYYYYTHVYAGHISKDIKNDECTRQKRQILQRRNIFYNGYELQLLTVEPFELNDFLQPICYHKTSRNTSLTLAGFNIADDISYMLRKRTILNESMSACPYMTEAICIDFRSNYALIEDTGGAAVDFTTNPPVLYGLLNGENFYDFRIISISRFKPWMDLVIEIDRPKIFPNCEKIDVNLFNNTCGLRDYPDSVNIATTYSIHGQYPWYTLIDERCGATLISPNHAVTSASCVFKNGELRKNFYVIAGTIYRDFYRDECSRQMLRVLNVYVHHNYSDLYSDGGMAVLTVETSKLNKYVQPACLQTSEEVLPSNGLISSFGNNFFGYEGARLQGIEVEILNNSFCGNTSHICIQKRNEGTCYGEGGSPLIIFKNKTAFLVGTSATTKPESCNDILYYTSISYYSSWIEKKMKKSPLPTEEDCQLVKVPSNMTINDTNKLYNRTQDKDLVERGEFPWHVNIERDGKLYRAGVLMDRTHVITASFNFYSFYEYYVYAGHVLCDFSLNECTRQKKKVLNSIDLGKISVLTTEPFELNIYVQPVKRNKNSTLPNTINIIGFSILPDISYELKKKKVSNVNYCYSYYYYLFCTDVKVVGDFESDRGSAVMNDADPPILVGLLSKHIDYYTYTYVWSVIDITFYNDWIDWFLSRDAPTIKPICENLSFNPYNGTCGKRSYREPRIRRGENAVHQQFPYQIQIEDFCGGVILDATHVLTAPNCVYLGSQLRTQIHLYAGNLYRDVSTDECSRQKVRVLNIDISDIALLTTEEIKFNLFVQPICTTTEQKYTGAGWITGFGQYLRALESFGYVNMVDRIPDRLQALQVQIYNETECGILLGTNPSATLCAGHNDKDKGLCYGDEGGPLVKIEDENATLVGIALPVESGCGGITRFVPVAPRMQWINDKIESQLPLLPTEEECAKALQNYFNFSSCDENSYNFSFNGGKISNIALRGQFPWHVSILYYGEIIQSGVLIDSRHVLTVYDYSNEWRTLYIQAGHIVRNTYLAGCTGQNKRVLKKENYNSLLSLFTIEPFDLNYFVQPSCQGQQLPSTFTLVGFDIAADISYMLRTIEVSNSNLVNDRKCLWNNDYICTNVTIPREVGIDKGSGVFNFETNPPTLVGILKRSSYYYNSFTFINTSSPELEFWIDFIKRKNQPIIQPDCSNNRINPFNGTCGERSYKETRIIGGLPAKHGQFPYQLSLDNKCGAILLDDTRSLTAANCIYDWKSKSLITNWKLYGGHIYRDLSISECSRQKVAVINVQLHHAFDGFSNDIAVLTHEKFNLNTFVQTACTPLENKVLPEKGWISGFGQWLLKDQHGNNLPSSVMNPIRLQGKMVEIVNASFQNETLGRNMSDKISVLSEAGGACIGDEGGPLTIFKEGKAVAVGIASTANNGSGCGETSFYTRIDRHLEWIKEKFTVDPMPEDWECRLVYLRTPIPEDKKNSTYLDPTLVRRGEMPWHVNVKKSDGTHQSGILLDEYHVLTTYIPLNYWETPLIITGHILRDNPIWECTRQSILARNHVHHYPLTILKASYPFQLNAFVHPIERDRSPSSELAVMSKSYMTTGFGLAKEASYMLRKAPIPKGSLFPRKYCPLPAYLGNEYQCASLPMYHNPETDYGSGVVNYGADGPRLNGILGMSYGNFMLVVDVKPFNDWIDSQLNNVTTVVPTIVPPEPTKPGPTEPEPTEPHPPPCEPTVPIPVQVTLIAGAFLLRIIAIFV